jgi:lipid-A-disaccharide synthase-like uncharacterized protein
MVFIFLIGLIGQIFFFARTFIQWLLSERQRKVLSPALYWIFSLIGSCIFFVYGWMRNDFSIILGQLITYFIYIWNLKIKGLWSKVFVVFQILLYLLPIAILFYFFGHLSMLFDTFFCKKDIPLWLILFGSVGQIIFSLRFVYQWYYSYRKQCSILPAGFWYISLTGSLIIIIYAIIRRDPILLLGQSVGLIAYIRNIIIGRKETTEKATKQ